MNPLYDLGGIRIFNGDCIEVMRAMEANSYSAVVTDPPYELTDGKSNKGFMGKAWDGSGIAFNVDMWREALRVTKPGGTLLAFGGTRTHHRLMVAIEDAGWEIRDVMMWLYGTGMPKGLNISKAIDLEAGAERLPVMASPYARRGSPQSMQGVNVMEGTPERDQFITAGATEAARTWEGYNTQLKPAWEPIVVAMKPLDGGYVQNALTWGVAGLNIDAGRVGKSKRTPGSLSAAAGGVIYGKFGQRNGTEDGYNSNVGRYPANVILSHDEGCVLRGTRQVKSGRAGERSGKNSLFGRADGDYLVGPTGSYGGSNGLETVEDWDCVDGCPVKMVDGQSGEGHPSFVRATPDKAYTDGLFPKPAKDRGARGFSDRGGASRFFKSIVSDHCCVLCDLPIDHKHGITSGNCSEDISCKNASGAAHNLSQIEKDSDSVLGVVLPSGPPEGEGKLDLLTWFVSSVVGSGETMPETTGSFALSDVRLIAIARNALSAPYAESLCISCVIAIVQGLVAIRQSIPVTSIRSLDSMPEHKRQILIQNLVPFAAMLESIDTIPTTASLNLLFGSVLHAIASYTKKDAEEQIIESGPPRFRYSSKSSRAERDEGLSGERSETQVTNMSGDGMPLRPDGTTRKLVRARNDHPTVKPLSLMKYLVGLVGMPRGTKILDPFMGSGTTLVAAQRLNYACDGIDLEAAHCEIARGRLSQQVLNLFGDHGNDD